MSEPNPKEFVQNFIDEKYAEIMDIIKKYPKQIPIPVVADLIGSAQSSVREAVEGGALGIAWRKDNAANKGYCVPTVKFVTWYLNIKVLGSG